MLPFCSDEENKGFLIAIGFLIRDSFFYVWKRGQNKYEKNGCKWT